MSKFVTRVPLSVYVASTSMCRLQVQIVWETFLEPFLSALIVCQNSYDYDNRIAMSVETPVDVTLAGQWFNIPPEPDLYVRSVNDLDGVRNADVVIALAPFGAGSVTEMAFAHGQGKPIVGLVPSNYVEFHEDQLILGVAHPLSEDDHPDNEGFITSADLEFLEKPNGFYLCSNLDTFQKQLEITCKAACLRKIDVMTGEENHV